MSTLILSEEINSNPFIYFHGTSSYFENKIDNEGINNNDPERVKLVYESYQLYYEICFCIIDGCNKIQIYNGFEKAIFKLQYAHADLLHGVKGKTFLTYFDSQAMSYTGRVGGEFYSGLIHMVDELEYIVNNYEEFNHKRKELYELELARWDEIYKGKFKNWTPYIPIKEEFLNKKYSLFRKFKYHYNQLLKNHKYGVIYVCKFDVEKLFKSEDVKVLSVSVDNVLPHEIIDKIIVTQEMQDEYSYGEFPLGIQKYERLKKIREIGKSTLEKVNKHLINNFELIDNFSLKRGSADQ